MIAIRGAVGILIGLVLAPLLFLVALVRGTRAVHADGVLCRAELDAVDAVIGPRLAGPALVRFSGAMQREGSATPDILGLALRLRAARDGEASPVIGDQDLVLGTFEGFSTAMKDKRRVDVDDYLANDYDSVTPWRVAGLGVVRLRALAAPARDRSRATTRRGRLEADIAAGVATLALGTHLDDGATGPVTPVATLRLVSISPLSPAQLRASLFRTDRGLTGVGLRNGIRRIVYPASQLARRLRGG